MVTTKVLKRVCDSNNLARQSACWVTGQTPFAGLQEFLGQATILAVSRD